MWMSLDFQSWTRLPRARQAEAKLGCAGKHVAKGLTACVPVGTARIAPWRYSEDAVVVAGGGTLEAVIQKVDCGLH